MEWKDVSDAIGKYAPGATALLSIASLIPGAGVVTGPAAIAISALSKVFGTDPTPDAIHQAISTDPQAALKLEQANLDYLLALEKEETERLRLQLADVNSARQREAAVKDKTNRNLAYFIILSFVCVVGFTLAGMTKVESVLAGTLIGYLSAKAEQVLAYYFGSSAGSQRKTEIIAKADAIKE